MKKSDRDAWTARLRDPASKQCHYAGAQAEFMSQLQGDEPMCCLVHGTFILGKDSTMYRYEMDKLIGDDAVSVLIHLNDKQAESLPAIADWIEANIPITE
jgi:hypothetical protein